MSGPTTDQPSLMIESDSGRPESRSVSVYNLSPDFIVSIRRYVQVGGQLTSILRVTVIPTGAPTGENLPDVFGRHQILEDGIRFIPHFPFERGLLYRAGFDPRPLDDPTLSEVLTLDFSLGRVQSAFPAEVKRIFPSSDYLPENLLRLYVCFSNAMQRGRVEAQISLLGPDGEPVADVLYRAPVELWDKSMRCLTVLLDPGRLKRGVGPNRDLGPPLKVGQEYTLAVGSELADLCGRPLRATFHKRFRVTEAVRTHIAVEQWKIVPPVTNSRQPLVLIFPRPLDWALVSQTITIVSTNEQPISGAITIDQCERRWSFTPTSPWRRGYYDVRADSSLEDVCGNSVMAAFDRPLRAGGDLACEMGSRSISFQLA